MADVGAGALRGVPGGADSGEAGDGEGMACGLLNPGSTRSEDNSNFLRWAKVYNRQSF